MTPCPPHVRDFLSWFVFISPWYISILYAPQMGKSRSRLKERCFQDSLRAVAHCPPIECLQGWKCSKSYLYLYLYVFVQTFRKKENAVANSGGAPVTGVPEAVRSAACPRKSSGSAWANGIKCANPCIKVTLQQRCKL